MAIADRVLLINNGRIVFDGKPADLTTGGSPEETFYRWTRDGASPADPELST
jgi:ABC-type uncharacterized transport system ATPase subunit